MSMSRTPAWPAAAALVLSLLIGAAACVQADAIQPVPRPIKGKAERAPAQELDTMPTAPMDMRLQQSRVWKQAKVNNMRIGQAFLAQHQAQPGVKTLKSGLQYQEMTLGEGPKPKKADSVEVMYQGSLVDGKVFVTAGAPGQPALLKLETAVPGLKQALLRMKVGSKWQLVVPPDLGYGDNGSPPAVGPGAVLIYDVELVGIRAGAPATAGTESKAVAP